MEPSGFVIYDLEEAAQLTGYAQVTLQRAIRKGELTPVGGEDACRISRVELERWYRSLEGNHASLHAGPGGPLPRR